MKSYFKQRVFSHSYSSSRAGLKSECGMSIVELLVSSTLSMLLIGMTLGVTLANRRLYGTDVVRTRINQNLRGAFDIIATELRQAGERLPSAFPAIEVIDGGTTASDTIILRRNLLDESLTLCQTVATGASGTTLYLSSTSGTAPPACVYGSQTASFDVWSTYLGTHDNSVDAFLFDFGTSAGEYFKFTAATNNDTTDTMSITSAAHSWERNYPGETSTIYILSEWRIALSTTAGQLDLLQLVENQDADSIKNITYGVTSLEVKAVLQDGTVQDSFSAEDGDSWTELQAIEISLTGTDTYQGQTISSTLKARLFPRNVLSN